MVQSDRDIRRGPVRVYSCMCLIIIISIRSYEAKALRANYQPISGAIGIGYHCARAQSSRACFSLP